MLRFICLGLLLSGGVGGDYEPTWESLDTRPLPSWYDEAKLGIFIHWGVFSVPSYGSEWFWEFWQGERHQERYAKFMSDNYRPNFTYQDFGPSFTAEFYDPSQWATLFNTSRAQYVVLTSKHHEGFTNWPSKHSWGWNSMDVGPKRDLVGELAHAIRHVAPHIHFGLYHSMFEWFNPLFLRDQHNQYQTNTFVTTKTLPELYELVNNYEPDLIWSDGDRMAEDWYWNSTIFLAWLFNSSPVKDTVVVNDRWGSGIPCHHGSYYTCHDRYNPGVLQTHKWENCMTLDKHSWGYRREATLHDFLTIHDLLTTLAQTISCGGNLLVNVGPTHDGRISPIMEERLTQLGAWLDINGQAVFKTKPWAHQNDTIAEGVWYTSKEDHVFAIVLSWPKNNELRLGSFSVKPTSKITMLGYQGDLQYTVDANVIVRFPDLSRVASQWVWVLDLVEVDPA